MMIGVIFIRPFTTSPFQPLSKGGQNHLYLPAAISGYHFGLPLIARLRLVLMIASGILPLLRNQSYWTLATAALTVSR